MLVVQISKRASVACTVIMCVGKLAVTSHFPITNAPIWGAPDQSDGFTGILELFAGPGNLSAAMRDAGFRIFGVDHEHNRHQPKVALVSLDLTESHSQDVALEMVQTIKPFAIHMGLPCGTCSPARDRALPSHLQDGHRAPPPLRSADHLMGFPHLDGSDLIKVRAANILYRFAIRVLHLCHLLNILVSIESIPKLAVGNSYTACDRIQ